ncbi:MAG TPA: GNAT family N-acetyltransferase [Pyrinomonadaceae bacterium]|nr:GNAT family N-acetyltransferase [Pyrinomonadaceae bacterium]
MIYRIANEKDFPQLAQMRWDFRQESGEEVAVVGQIEFIENCVDFLQTEAKNYVYWVAESDGEIVSHIFVYRINLVPRPCRVKDSFAYLTNTYTKSEFRGKGIGGELLKTLIEWAKAEDFELLLVYPSEESLNFYGRLGFENDKEVLKLVLRDY